MRVRSKRGGANERGWTLVVVAFAAFLAVAASGFVLVVTRSSDRAAQSSRFSNQAQYLAEGALEVAELAFLDAVAAAGAPTDGMTTIDGTDVNYTVTEVEPTLFQITATATIRSHSFTSNCLMSSTGGVPLSRYAVFYDGDLELSPGSEMTIAGRVHTNSDMYFAPRNGLVLNTNYVHAVGGLYRKRKGAGDVQNGPLRIRKWVEDPFDPSEPVEYVELLNKADMASQGVSTTNGYDSDFTAGHDANGDGDFDDPGDWFPFGPGALERWDEPDAYFGGTGSTLKTGVNGITPAAVPEFDSVAMFEEMPGSTGGDYEWSSGSNTYVEVAPGTGTHNKGTYHAEADLSIITYANGTWKAFDGNGFDVTSGLTGVVSKSDLYDARQAQGSSTRLKTTEIDIQKLNASGYFPKNGLLYAGTYGAGTGTNVKGITLKNGAELKSSLSVVSENSIYVHGDYNKTNKKPALVMADAVNLLSNAWNNSKKKGNLPNASSTTYNMAIVSGNVDSTSSDYSGGVENLPRLHEKWKGKTCTIAGTFICLWKSKYANAPWKGGSPYYLSPKRAWSYDISFNDPAFVPPFMPATTGGAARRLVSW